MSPDSEAAARAFATTLRLQLIAHFRDHPGAQVDAARALGAGRNVISANVRVLEDAGVLRRSPSNDGRSSTLNVDADRVRALLRALETELLHISQ
jgi:DNA-binding MarR family transcriptional regulator